MAQQITYGSITISDLTDITDVYLEYGLAVNNAEVDNYYAFNQSGERGWLTTYPTWTSGYQIWVRQVTEKEGLPNEYGTPYLDTAVNQINNSINQINSTFDTKLKYFWTNLVGSQTYPAGTYTASGINGVTFDTEDSSTYGYNTYYGNGIQLRYNALDMATLTGNALTFYQPPTINETTTIQGNKTMELSGNSLKFYNPSSNSTIPIAEYGNTIKFYDSRVTDKVLAEFGIIDNSPQITMGTPNATHVKIIDDEFGFYDKNRKVSFISADQGMSVQFPLRVGEHLEFTENQSYSLVTEKKIAEGETLYIKQEAGAGDEYVPIDNLKEYNFNHRLDDSAYKIYLKEERYIQQIINNFIDGVNYYKQAEESYVLKEESNVIYGEVYYIQNGYDYKSIEVHKFASGTQYYEEVDGEYQLTADVKPVYGKEYYIELGDEGYALDDNVGFNPNLTYFYKNNNVYVEVVKNDAYVDGREYSIRNPKYVLDNTIGFDPNLTYYKNIDNTYIEVENGEEFTNINYYIPSEDVYKEVSTSEIYDENIDYYFKESNNYVPIETYILPNNGIYLSTSEQTVDTTLYQLILGIYNEPNPDALLIIGNGSGESKDKRSNGLIIRKNGQLLISNNAAIQFKDSSGNIIEGAIFVSTNNNFYIGTPQIPTRLRGKSICIENSSVFNEAVTFKKKMTVQSGGVAIYGGLTINSGTTTLQSLIASGSTNLKSGLTVTGNSIFNNKLTIKGGLSVTGSETITGTLTTTSTILPGASVRFKNGNGLAGYGTRTSLIYTIGYVNSSNKVVIGDSRVPLIIRGKNKGSKNTYILNADGYLTLGSGINCGGSIVIPNGKGLVGYTANDSTTRTIGYVSSNNNVIIGDNDTNTIIRGKNKGPYGDFILNSDGVFSPGDSIYLSNNKRIGAYKKGSTSIQYRLVGLSETNNVLVADTDVDTYIYGKSITIGGRDASLFLNRGNITMDHHEVSTGTIKAKSYGEISKAFSKSGYYPYGIVGWYLVGSGQSYLSIYRLRLSNRDSGTATIQCHFRNTMENTDFSGTLHVDILWIKIL